MENLIIDEEILNPLQNPSHLKRASTEKLREIFNRYASKEINGEKYMTSEDFVRKYLGLFPDSNFNDVSFMFFIGIKQD
jgi:solute carrier family 25 (mitochondrial aspartate/glutamate transporter), member 12/13